MSDQQPPGHYHAEGDPVGTMRYWDGTQWVGGPTSAPPRPSPSQHHSRDHYGGVGIRIGASLIDGVLYFVVFLAVFVIAAASDGSSIDGSDTDATGAFILFLSTVVIFFGTISMVALAGGTPGKLMVGLRVTASDSVTTPPGWGRAFKRSVVDLVGVVPVLGALLSIGVAIANLVMVSNDEERRSIYDRIGGTRVVYKRHLTA